MGQQSGKKFTEKDKEFSRKDAKKEK